MPTAPLEAQAPSSGSLSPQPSQLALWMAAATMHQLNRLPTFEERATPTKEAIASGEFDPAGMNYTQFEKAKPRVR